MHMKTYRNLSKASTVILMLSVLLNIGLARQILTQKYEARRQMKEVALEAEKRIEENNANLTSQLTKTYELMIKETFTKEELANAMQRQWQYMISVNGEEIKTNKKYIPQGNVRVMIAEVLKDESILSHEILKLGSLDELIEHMTLEDLVEVYSTVPYKLKREETEVGIKYYYEFIEVPAETLIVLEFNPLLTERLEYKNTIKENKITLITKA